MLPVTPAQEQAGVLSPGRAGARQHCPRCLHPSGLALSPCHTPHRVTLGMGTGMSHRATLRTGHSTYIRSLGPRCSTGSRKALQANLASNPWGPFGSLCSA